MDRWKTVFSPVASSLKCSNVFLNFSSPAQIYGHMYLLTLFVSPQYLFPFLHYCNFERIFLSGSSDTLVLKRSHSETGWSSVPLNCSRCFKSLTLLTVANISSSSERHVSAPESRVFLESSRSSLANAVFCGRWSWSMTSWHEKAFFISLRCVVPIDTLVVNTGR